MSRLVLMFFIVPDYLSAGGAPDVRVNARPLVALGGGGSGLGSGRWGLWPGSRRGLIFAV